MVKTIKVVDATSADTVPVEAEEQTDRALNEIEPETISDDMPELTPEKKNIKTVELFECEKCGKKLTARTLKYSHHKMCPKNEGRSQQAQAPKLEKKEQLQEPEHKPALTAYEQRMLKIRERQDKIKRLVSLAF